MGLGQAVPSRVPRGPAPRLTLYLDGEDTHVHPPPCPPSARALAKDELNEPPANLSCPCCPPDPTAALGPSLPPTLPLLLWLGDLGEPAARFLQLRQGVGWGERGHGGVLDEGVGRLRPARVAAGPPGVVAAGGPLGEVGAVGLLCALCAWGGEEVGLEKLENMTLIAAPILLAPSQKSVIT